MTKKIANRLQVNALLDPMLHERLDAYCKQKKVERSVALRTALNLMLDHEAKGGDIAEIKADIKKLSEAMASGGAQPGTGKAPASAADVELVNKNIMNLYGRLSGQKDDKSMSIPNIGARLDELAALLRGRGQ